MADNGYVHRDINPSNILIKDNILKISSFNFATKKLDCFDTNKKINEPVGTPEYSSP